jgi:hypothetical protein
MTGRHHSWSYTVSLLCALIVGVAAAVSLIINPPAAHADDGDRCVPAGTATILGQATVCKRPDGSFYMFGPGPLPRQEIPNMPPGLIPAGL